jgi:hypothetical protein
MRTICFLLSFVVFITSNRTFAQTIKLNDAAIWKASFPENREFDDEKLLIRNEIKKGDTVEYHTEIAHRFYYLDNQQNKAVAILLSYDFSYGAKADCHACYPIMSIVAFRLTDNKWVPEKFIHEFEGSSGSWGEGPKVSIKKIKGQNYLAIESGYGNQGQFSTTSDYYRLDTFKKVRP